MPTVLMTFFLKKIHCHWNEYRSHQTNASKKSKRNRQGKKKVTTNSLQFSYRPAITITCYLHIIILAFDWLILFNTNIFLRLQFACSIFEKSSDQMIFYNNAW